MSTRATIKIVENKDVIWVYRHCDGYPETTFEDLKNTLSNIGKYTDAFEIATEIIQSKDTTFPYELTSCQHGDEEYAYLIDVEKRELKCYKVGGDEYEWNEEKVIQKTNF